MRTRAGHRNVRPGHVLLVLLIYGGLLTGMLVMACRLDAMREVDVSVVETSGTLDQAIVSYGGQTYVRRGSVSVYLLLGLDDQSPRCADYALALVVDEDRRTMQCLPIAPETLVPLAGEAEDAAVRLSTGGITEGLEESRRAFAEQVALLLRAEPDGTMAFEMRAIPTLNDALGGVEITALQDWSALDEALVPGASVRLSGTLADRFVRSLLTEDGAGSTERMKRQRVYVAAAAAALQEHLRADAGYLDTLLDALSGSFSSSLSRSALASLAYRLRDYKLLPDLTIPGTYGTDASGVCVFEPDGEALWKLVLDVLYEPQTL